MEQLKVGLQLYSIRNAMAEDVIGALKEVKKMGYDYVEMAGGRYNRSALELKENIESCDLKCVSAHQSPTFFLNDKEDAVNYIKDLGVKYCVIPIAAGREEAFTKNWDTTIPLYEEMGKAFGEIGVKLLYHNHDFEFLKLEGDREFILDRLLSTVPETLLQPELDTCWVSYGGVDPAKQIRKYANRLDVVHLKDYNLLTAPEQMPMWELLEKGILSEKPAKKSEVGFRYAPVGSGLNHWDPILDAVKASTAQYVVVEQDDSKDRDPLEAAAMSRRFLKDRFGL